MSWQPVLLLLCLAPAALAQDAAPAGTAEKHPAKAMQILGAGKYPVTDINVGVLLSATYAADGRWVELELDETLARKAIAASLRLNGLPDKPVPAVVATMRRRMQLILLAQHNGTLEDILKMPPFSRFADKNLRRLGAAYATSGDEGMKLEWDQIFAPGWAASRPTDGPKLEGGPGDSKETAVKVDAANETEGIALEYGYVAYTLGRQGPEWTRNKQGLSMDKGRQFDMIDVNLTGGGTRTFYFDITGFYGKM
jgi:hypothetical protein